ncbi:hypothetical protein ACXXCT_08595 [Bordetella bronchiseptica]
MTPIPAGWKLVPIEPTAEMWAAVNKLDDEMAAGAYDGKGASIEQVWNCLVETAPESPPITVALDPDPRGVSVGVWQGSRCIYTGAHPLPAAPGSPASAAPGDAQDERQWFEAWAEKKKMPLARIGQQYDDFWVDHAWNGWQARARLSAPATDDTPSRFTISASDRFELTGAVGLLRGCGYGGPATALQRVLDAESASFSVQGEDDARDAGRYRTVRQVAADKENGYALMAEASREVGIEVGQYPTPEQFDAVVDLVAAQQGKGSKA